MLWLRGAKTQKLIIHVINFELVQPICPGYINVTDRQTDGRTTYDSNTVLALRASRGKNTGVIYSFQDTASENTENCCCR